MPLDLPDGMACFLDANIFYYALVPTAIVSKPCRALLSRAAAGAISILISLQTLSDAIHKVMISEAAQLTKRNRARMVGYLGRHPEIVSRLVEYPKALDRLLAVPLTILPTDESVLRDATLIATEHGLLTNHALIVALMRRHQLTNLVTNDADFERVPGLTIWKPR